MKNLNKIVVAACLSTGLLVTALPVQATENCDIGGTCVLNRDGQTYFSINPKHGLQYECKVTANNNGSIYFNVAGGQDFTVDTGYGPQRAAPVATIKLSGHFKNLNDPNELGQLKFTKLAGQDATVSCKAIS